MQENNCQQAKAFKEETQKYFKEAQEILGQQAEALKDEKNPLRNYRKTQTIKWRNWTKVSRL